MPSCDTPANRDDVIDDVIALLVIDLLVVADLQWDVGPLCVQRGPGLGGGQTISRARLLSSWTRPLRSTARTSRCNFTPVRPATRLRRSLQPPTSWTGPADKPSHSTSTATAQRPLTRTSVRQVLLLLLLLLLPLLRVPRRLPQLLKKSTWHRTSAAAARASALTASRCCALPLTRPGLSQAAGKSVQLAHIGPSAIRQAADRQAVDPCTAHGAVPDRFDQLYDKYETRSRFASFITQTKGRVDRNALTAKLSDAVRFKVDRRGEGWGGGPGRKRPCVCVCVCLCVCGGGGGCCAVRDHSPSRSAFLTPVAHRLGDVYAGQRRAGPGIRSSEPLAWPARAVAATGPFLFSRAQ